MHDVVNYVKSKLARKSYYICQENSPLQPAYLALKEAASLWGLSLDPEQLVQIERYEQELLAANMRLNLVADADPETVLLRHIADGLAAAGVLIKEATIPAPRILDLGAGSGCIGMALKIAWPQSRVTLMESSQRKYRFLNAMAARSGIGGLTVSLGRAGQGPGASGFDIVVARALAPLPQAAQLALPMTKIGGIFLAYQSAPPNPEDPRLQRVLARHAARLVKSIPYRLPREDRDRCLALFSKGE